MRPTCLTCGARCVRDNYDMPRCKGCGETDFCCESCRDEHLADLHPELAAAEADPVTDAEYDAFWLNKLEAQRNEFTRRFGLAAPRRVA